MMLRSFLTLSTIFVASALDVEIVEFSCDESLPLTGTLSIVCDRGGRCTFGEEAVVNGQMTYNGLADSGIQNNYAYITSTISLFALDFSLFEMMQVPLCNEDYLVANGNNANGDCPADGSYSFSVPYKLPNSGAETSSWLASGWQGDGIISIYAAADESMLVGQCSMDLQTYVTRNEDAGFLRQTPSAAATTGIVLGALAILGLCCMYCMCCLRKKRGKNVDDTSTQFTRMNDIPSSIGGASTKANSMA